MKKRDLLCNCSVRRVDSACVYWYLQWSFRRIGS